MTKTPTHDPGLSPPSPRFARPRLASTLVATGLVVCAAAALMLLARPQRRPADERGAAIEAPGDKMPAPSSDLDPAIYGKPKLIEVDAPIWMSPTSGPPLDLAWLPPGVQIVAAIRPAAIVAHAEGEKVLAALGPLGQRGLRAIEQATGRPLAELEQLVVGWQTNEQGDWEVSLVVIVRSEAKTSTSQLSSSLSRWNRYERPATAGRTIVAASPAALEEIKLLDGRAPPLRRAMQQLVDASDCTRDFTLLVAPSYLFGDGHAVFDGEASRLRGPLGWFLGEGLAAASLSLHWDENFFVELRAVPALDTPTDEIAGQLVERVRQLPEAVGRYIASLHPSGYSRNILARLPAMVDRLAAHTRAAYNRDEVVLRSYLPVSAGHNLMMGAELALAEPPPATPLQQTLALGSLAERLEHRTTLRFPRDTLETALDMLAQDLGVEIILLGSDLQLEGITKNQSLGLDLADRPAREILVEILRQANPDKSAGGPADERQRLVYVIKPRGPGRAEAIFITTRAQARRRGDRLPEVFQRPTDEQPAN